MSPSTSPARELAARESDGIHVALLWHPAENALTLAVADARMGSHFELAVTPDRAPSTRSTTPSRTPRSGLPDHHTTRRRK